MAADKNQNSCFTLQQCHNICFPKHTDQHSGSLSFLLTKYHNSTKKMDVEHSSKLSNKVKNKWSYALLHHMSSGHVQGQLHLTLISAKKKTIHNHNNDYNHQARSSYANCCQSVSEFSRYGINYHISNMGNAARVVKCADESHKFQYSWKCIFFPSFYGTTRKFTYVINHKMHVQYSFSSTALHFHFDLF